MDEFKKPDFENPNETGSFPEPEENPKKRNKLTVADGFKAKWSKYMFIGSLISFIIVLIASAITLGSFFSKHKIRLTSYNETAITASCEANITGGVL